MSTLLAKQKRLDIKYLHPPGPGPEKPQTNWQTATAQLQFATSSRMACMIFLELLSSCQGCGVSTLLPGKVMQGFRSHGPLCRAQGTQLGILEERLSGPSRRFFAEGPEGRAGWHTSN